MKLPFPSVLALAILLAPAMLPAESPTFPVAGRFYLEVDDTVTVYHNGAKLHTGKNGASESKDVNLAPGDRLVLALWNKGKARGLKLLFVSADRKFAINFGVDSFRILRDPDKRDFTEKEFALWKEPAQRAKHTARDHLAFKNKADWIWGEKHLGETYVAAVITKRMFENFTP